MKILKTTSIFILLSLFSVYAFAQKSEEDVKTLLIERDQEIKDIVGPEGKEYTEEQRATLKEIINGIINFEAMAKIALEETYYTISDEQREEFLDLFSTIVRDHSLTNLDIYRAQVNYESIEVNGDSAYVATLAQLEKVRTPVNYNLFFQDDQWVIIDMSVDDVWTAKSYNRQFQRIINKRGFDSLMESLRKRAARS